jgi:tetratricopeptide (TPR) repeat protein
MVATGGKINARLRRHRRAVEIALIAAAAVLPFLPAFGSPFIFDDLNTIAQNPALAQFDVARFFTDPTAFSVKIGNWPYRPALMTFDAIRLSFFGLDPRGWHLSELFLHLLNSLLVYLLAARIFKLHRTAFFAGLLFALSPLQTQAVIYLSARSMVVACLPALLATMLAVRAREAERGKAWALAGAAALTALALLCSEGAMAVVAWAALAFYARGDALRDRRSYNVLLALAAVGVAYYLVRGSMKVPSPAEAIRISGGRFDLYEHFRVQLLAPFVLLRLFLYPVGLSFFHLAPPIGATDLRFLLAVTALAGIGFLLYRFRDRRALVAGVAWYFLSLLPSVLVPLNIPWAEHRAYLALPGLCLAAADLLGWLADQAGSDRKKVFALGGLVAAVMALFVLLSWGRARTYRSAASLYRDAVRQSPAYYVAWNFLGADAYARDDCRHALAYLDWTIKLNPDFADAYNTRSACQLKSGDYIKAGDSAFQAIKLDPENASYMNSLAVILMTLDKYPEAEYWLSRALKIMAQSDPNRPTIEKNWRTLKLEMEPGSPGGGGEGEGATPGGE